MAARRDGRGGRIEPPRPERKARRKSQPLRAAAALPGAVAGKRSRLPAAPNELSRVDWIGGVGRKEKPLAIPPALPFAPVLTQKSNCAPILKNLACRMLSGVRHGF